MENSDVIWVSTDSAIVESDDIVYFTGRTIDCLLILAPFGDVIGYEIRCPLRCHTILELGVVNNRGFLLKA